MRTNSVTLSLLVCDCGGGGGGGSGRGTYKCDSNTNKLFKQYETNKRHIVFETTFLAQIVSYLRKYRSGQS